MGTEVLILDRDAALARLYCGVLANHGFSAETVASAPKCRDMLRHRSRDVLVLDREIPNQGATRLIACLKKEEMSTRVVLTTWTATAELTRRLVVPPVVLCLRKFFPLPALVDAVRIATQSIGTRHTVCGTLDVA
jgi:DNA-binding NtrC family response regulator